MNRTINNRSYEATYGVGSVICLHH